LFTEISYRNLHVHVADRVITVVAECVLDIAFIVDCSGSIRDTHRPVIDNWELIIDFLVNVVSSFTIGVNEALFGAVSFGTQSNLYLFTLLCAEMLPEGKAKNILRQAKQIKRRKKGTS